MDYFNLEKQDSVQGWRKKWFYIKDQAVTGQQYGLAPFDPAARAKKSRAWRHELTAAEEADVAPLYRRVVELRRTAGLEVSGLQLIALFVKRCIQPIQFRPHPMWRFEGAQDPTRVLHEEFSSIELESRVHRITKLGQKDKCLLECPVRPFAADNPLPEVTRHLRRIVCGLCFAVVLMLSFSLV